MMHKTIDLNADPVFRHSVRLNLNRNYAARADVAVESVRRKARAVADCIVTLVLRGELDTNDLCIIKMRERSPMPTWREIGETLRMTKMGAYLRGEKIKKSISTMLLNEIHFTKTPYR